MRKIIVCAGIILANSFVAQTGNEPNNTSANNHIPTIIPPTPTVASLMKFEEIPVNKYTGTPDVSIPLFNVAADHGLILDLSIKYHPSSIKKDEVAGYTGLGWSLFAGGTISRTVRDIPDEYYRAAGMFNREKIGIYDSRNNYYDAVPLLNTNNLIDDTNPEINEFFFEVSEKNKFDSKHDLYQYNFMGYSGRFIIEKSGNNYNVVKLSKDNLQISYNHADNVFEIIDNRGLKYIFDIKELTKSTSFNESVTFKGDSSLSATSDYDYVSSFHVSKILYGNNVLAEFLYNSDSEPLIEKQGTKNSVNNVPVNPDLSLFVNADQNGTCSGHIPTSLLPLYSNQSTTVDTKTKKLKKIKITDRAVIEFTNQTGSRQDQNIINSTNTPYLSQITIKDWNERLIKSYVFEYSYLQKLFLKNITETSGSNEISKFSFSYKDNTLPQTDFKTDYWGYYKALGTDCDNTLFSGNLIENRDVDKQYITKDILTQITYPTKGVAVFEYEPNTYSYVGDLEIPTTYTTNDYFEFLEDNPDNWTVTDFNDFFLQSSNGNQQIQNLGFFTTDKTLILQSSIDNNEGTAGYLKLYKKNSSHQIIETIGLITGCPQELHLKGGFEYAIGFVWNHQIQIGDNPHNVPVIGHASVFADVKTRNTDTKKWLYGGGVRIKNIYYLDQLNSAISSDILNQGYPGTFNRKISYDYSFFDDGERSSGSLAYLKPIMSYEAERIFKYGNFPCNLDPVNWNIIYRIKTKTNNLSHISTQGGDVGYKNVKIYETGKGRSEFTFTSPIDYPELLGSQSVVYPFAPTKNIDYKRGLLLSEKKYDNSGRIVTSSENTYDFEDHEKITGVTVYYKDHDCPFTSQYSSYFAYKSAISSSGCDINNLMCFNAKQCGPDATSFLTFHLNKEAFGWSKLVNSTSKNYLYDGNGLQTNIESNTAYVYSSNNMQPLKQTTNRGGEISEVSYSYAHEKGNIKLINANMINIPLETSVVEKETPSATGTLISKTETKYDDASHLFPTSIVSYHLQSGNASTQVTYDQYDAKGNLLQYTTKDGVSTAIIWGYNGIQPIAKIEGALYDNIKNNSLITAIINASNADAANPATESSLITALDNLRNDVSFKDFQMATVTYDPLIGVTTLTPPSGIREIYKYDSANRLEKIVDQEGKILKEFKYNYKH